MIRCFYIILFFTTGWMVSSCRTTETAKTTLTQTKQNAGYTIVIIINDSGTLMDRIMYRIHQSGSVIAMQVTMNDDFINPACEIRILITAVNDRQINEIRNALYAIPEVKMIKISKN